MISCLKNFFCIQYLCFASEIFFPLLVCLTDHSEYLITDITCNYSQYIFLYEVLKNHRSC